MSQGFFNALIMGPKEVPAAQKVAKFVACFQLFFLIIAGAVLLLLNDTVEVEVPELFHSIELLIGLLGVQAICSVFLFKGKFWAAIALIVIEVVNSVAGYLETGDIMGSVNGLSMLLLISALQATNFICTQQKLDEDRAAIKDGGGRI
ncbi:hypothetical protein [Thaumasiovibrio subtropicus]|uniref:hypothetical protein n=1 Tax=Thaumasiovibrio subtropicus TaxID=1891207 RepID=UPI000B35EAB5|nr:hypothetical protein [Thaumasiovibrio subtropicus]